MLMSWVVYDKYNDHPSLKHVAAVLTDITEQDTQVRQKQIREYLLKNNKCLEQSSNEQIAAANNDMRNLVTILDGALYFFKKMKTQSGNRPAAEKTFSEYQVFITQNMVILEKHSQLASKTVLNEYLHLNKALLPRENSTKGKNAVEISTVLLERALTDEILICMNKLAGSSTGCD
jgi:hypothetical protein